MGEVEGGLQARFETALLLYICTCIESPSRGDYFHGPAMGL